MSGQFVAFDLETTGLSAKTDRIIEVGAVRFTADGTVIGELDLIVDPGMPIPLAIQRLVGLTDADVRGEPSPAEALAQLVDFSDGASLVAHGAAFDLAYCAAVMPQIFAQRTVFDTLELARILLPTAASHSLPLLSAQLGIGHDRPHRADSDADATRALFVHLMGVVEQLPVGVVSAIRGLLTTSATPLRTFFGDVATSRGDATRPDVHGGLPPPARATRSARVGTDLGAEAAALLGPEGPLADDMYEYRDAQIEMARAVGQTLQRNGRLMIEAGTGVGKSFAYLAPLLLHAANGGGRGVVATHTITLQEQLVNRDIPRVNATLRHPVTVAMLKGRHHYLSLRRWQRFLRQTDDSVETLRFKLKILVWLAETESGDRSSLRLPSGDDALWRQVESDTADCLGNACANWKNARCFMVAARRAAAEADVVVTNHALLLADAERQGTVLERYSSLIVDEAHRLEESATRQLGSRLRAVDIMERLDRLPDGTTNPVGELLDEARAATKRLFGDVKGTVAAILGHDTPANATVAWSEEAAATVSGAALIRSAQQVVAVLRNTASALVSNATTQLPLISDPDHRDDEAGLAAFALMEAAATIERVVVAPRDGYVRWLELRAENGELHEAPISVAGQLHSSVFEKSEAVVLTSATLSVAGSFDFVRERIGVGGGADALILSSPFDYLRQALSVVPTDIPPYDDAHYDEAIARLIGDIAIRLGGRTLALFTSYSALRKVHGALDRRLGGEGLAVLGQGLDGTRRQVLESFLANPRTVLLGTSSFWEGIDIPGDALRCVVITKLPFAVPTDPLVRARSDALSDPFRGYVLPAAVLRLKQGFGRLIRRSDDRGAVVIADARLGSRDYARTFLEALPPASVAWLPGDDVAAAVAGFVNDGTLPEGAHAVADVTTEARQLAVGIAPDPHHEDPA